MDETRINAAVAELNAMIQSLIQRNINLAGDLAVANQTNQQLGKDLAEAHKRLAPVDMGAPPNTEGLGSISTD